MRAVVAIVLAFAALAAAVPASAAPLTAGAGRSDVTPPTGFATFGYVRSDGIARGQHTRLFARAIVLQEGDRKLALVTTDLGFTPGGLLQDIAKRVENRGFSERNIIVSASHTHSAPAGYANFGSDNFVAPTQGTPTSFQTEGDPQLYGFMVDRIAIAITRADSDRGPARAGWGSADLENVTDNRSLEAHLANFGYDLPYGTGKIDQDPNGYRGTIDPAVDVLRVDRITKKRSIPLGAWLNFADHGTVNPFQFGVYNGDHHGPASRIFEKAVRKRGHVPKKREVVGAYGNSDAGDMTAGLRGRGPAFAQKVGKQEADAMLAAWKQAGAKLSSEPPFDLRWTRSCFCGRTVDGGQVSDHPSMGFPFFTGSEEARGPLYDADGVNHEGDRLPVGVGAQGRKIETVQPPASDFPRAVPLMVVRLGDRAIATVPGEMTIEMGKRTRAAVLAAMQPAGVNRVTLAGYANEFLHYFVTPEEYDMQHYEGGSTLFGRVSSNLIKDDLATLGGDLARGSAAPDPDGFDPRNGFSPDFTPYDPGAASASASEQPPARVERLQRALFAWKGAPRGFDRPLDTAFVSVQRKVGRGRWRTVTDDLGLQIIWRVNEDGRYDAQWQIPLSAPTQGHYRMLVTARRYRIASRPFRVVVSHALTVKSADAGGVTLDYPPVELLEDITARPDRAAGGIIRARTSSGRKIARRQRRGQVFTLPPGSRIAAGAARDRYGNRNIKAFTPAR